MLPFLGKRVISNTLGALALSSLFLGNATGAQETPENDTNLEQRESHIQAMVQDLSDHPLAGATLMMEVCVVDDLDKRECDMAEVTLPLPQLNNPVGYPVQELRRDLALMIEQTERDADGMPLAEELREGGLRVAASFETMMDSYALEFKNPDTFMTLMNLHYDVIQASENANLEEFETIIGALRGVVLQLEEDLLSVAEKALRDALEAQAEALENGATSEELEALNDAVMEAMEGLLQEQIEQGEDEGLSPADMENMEMMKELMEEMARILEELGITPEEFAKMLQEMMGGGGSPPPGGAPQGEQEEQTLEQMLDALKKQIEMMQKMYKFMGELNAITEELQTLRDQTLSEALEATRESPDASDLAEIDEMETKQDSLNERLEALIDGMKNEGLPTEALDYALNEMREAESDLERNNTGEAVPHQDEALEVLNSSSESMAMMMMMMPGAGPQSGAGPEMPSQGSGTDGRSIIDNEGRLLDSDNQSEDMGVELEDGDKDSRGVRDSIIRRQQQGEGQTSRDSFLDRLLEDPLAP